MLRFLFLFVWLAPGCTETVTGSVGLPSDDPSDGGDRTVEAGSGAVAGAEATSETTVGVASGAEEAAGGAAGSPSAPFVEEPRASGGTGYGADTVLVVRYGRHDGYERVVLDLGVGEEQARRVPEWTLTNLPGRGPLRVVFLSASATGVSDGTLGGASGEALLDRFYVVRDPEGGMFVDVFARRA